MDVYIPFVNDVTHIALQYLEGQISKDEFADAVIMLMSKYKLISAE